MLYPYKPRACLWRDGSLLVTPIRAPLPQPPTPPPQLLSYPPCEQPNNNVTKHAKVKGKRWIIGCMAQRPQHTASTSRNTVNKKKPGRTLLWVCLPVRLGGPTHGVKNVNKQKYIAKQDAAVGLSSWQFRRTHRHYEALPTVDVYEAKLCSAQL